LHQKKSANGAENVTETSKEAQDDVKAESAVYGAIGHRGDFEVWAFDSEFLVSGEKRRQGDVQTIQFSDGRDLNVRVNETKAKDKEALSKGTTVVFDNAEDLKEFLHNRRSCLSPTVYCFVALPDLGSLATWLGDGNVRVSKRGVRVSGIVKYGHGDVKFNVYDAQPLLHSFGFRNLAACGQYLGVPKLLKPEWLGLRDPKDAAEHAYFMEYAARDAYVTSRIVRWMIEKFNADPARLVSSGTLAKEFFNFPCRLGRNAFGVPTPSPIEQAIQRSTFAGRSEGFVTGYVPNVFYNDVSSLYPVSMVASRCFDIASAYEVDEVDDGLDQLGLHVGEVVERDLSYDRDSFGWIEGYFETDHDLWGLPIRGFRNFYMVGKRIQGLFNTFDLAAAKARLVFAAHVWLPKLEPSVIQEKFADMLLERVEGRCDPVKKMFYKAVLNSASGKLGQSKPFAARTSNFLAYNKLLGHSHLIMSKLFDKCIGVGGQPLAMDTDSVFSTVDMSKKWFEVCDGDHVVPVVMDCKARGNLAFFRSKRYILWDKSKPYEFNKNPAFAMHGWHYFVEDYLKLFDGALDELDTRIEIKHTLLTHTKAALMLALGHWRTRPEHLSFDKLESLLTADDKRDRGGVGGENYRNSYLLVRERRSQGSKAWVYRKHSRNLGVGSE
jgi:hypothetical protein